MKKAVSSARSTVGKTAKKMIKVPQAVGRTILSVPGAVLGKSKGKGSPKQKPEFADTIEFISKEIIGDQENNGLVRESQAQCMKEVSNHLATYLVENPDATYEEWITSLHPDNAEYDDGAIDHRFYVEQSDHRLLWNECMQAIHSNDRVVQIRSVEPTYNRKR
mmetsp:Transcript_16555/g.24772  ORF Transcript_16555/g.24772 Transcript_16555/m.24772 type:complete len:163 (-) Transcript_16555:129-617(-)